MSIIETGGCAPHATAAGGRARGTDCRRFVFQPDFRWLPLSSDGNSLALSTYEASGARQLRNLFGGNVEEDPELPTTLRVFID